MIESLSQRYLSSCLSGLLEIGCKLIERVIKRRDESSEKREYGPANVASNANVHSKITDRFGCSKAFSLNNGTLFDRRETVRYGAVSSIGRAQFSA